MLDIGHGSVSSHLSRIELGLPYDARQALHGHSAFVRKIRVKSKLEAHSGCVNRLAFSEDASFLISGSDDCTLRMWSVDSPTSLTEVGTVESGHLANIFGVAFMPGTSNKCVVSAGLDKQVHHTHVETGSTMRWTCHQKSVKTVSALDEHTFVTSSRDGTVRLFDVRLSVTTEPPVVVRIPVRISQNLALNSAIRSPICAHHLLVTASDADIRVFDLRLSPPSTTTSAAGSAVETYCPSHMHPTAPEQLSCMGFRSVSATYANFSSDARLIVASYLGDSVFVFDRQYQEGESQEISACKNSNVSKSSRIWNGTTPFSSRRRCLVAISRLLQDAASLLACKQYAAAVSAANHALILDPRNLFGLVCKAYALQRREISSDLRNSYATLQEAMDILNEDETGESIAYLWSFSSDLLGTHGMSLVPPISSVNNYIQRQTYRYSRNDSVSTSWLEKKDIWMAAFEYMQAFNLSRMVSSVYFSMQYSPRSLERIVTLKRLEYVEGMCDRLEKYRIDKCPSYITQPASWLKHIRRALGSEEEQEFLYSGPGGDLRRFVLEELIQNFNIGLDSLRHASSCNISCMRPDDADSTDTPASGDTLGSSRNGTGGASSTLSVQVQPPHRRRMYHQQFEDDDDNRHFEDNEDHEDHAVDIDDGATSSDSDFDNSSLERRYPPSLLDLFVCNRTRLKGGVEEENALWGTLKQSKGHRYFTGHASKHTEIKESNFFGSNNQIVMSGSDDGHIFMWSTETGELLNRTEADGQIVNCVLGHPQHTMVLASGIDDSIKVLAP